MIAGMKGRCRVISRLVNLKRPEIRHSFAGGAGSWRPTAPQESKCKYDEKKQMRKPIHILFHSYLNFINQ